MASKILTKLRRQWGSENDSLVRAWRSTIFVINRSIQVTFKQKTWTSRHIHSKTTYGFLATFIWNSFNDYLRSKYENFYAIKNTRYKNAISPLLFWENECSGKCTELWNWE